MIEKLVRNMLLSGLIFVAPNVSATPCHLSQNLSSKRMVASRSFSSSYFANYPSRNMYSINNYDFGRKSLIYPDDISSNDYKRIESALLAPTPLIDTCRVAQTGYLQKIGLGLNLLRMFEVVSVNLGKYASDSESKPDFIVPVISKRF
jgi:hypothetical protein